MTPSLLSEKLCSQFFVLLGIASAAFVSALWAWSSHTERLTAEPSSITCLPSSASPAFPHPGFFSLSNLGSSYSSSNTMYSCPSEPLHRLSPLPKETPLLSSPSPTPPTQPGELWFIFCIRVKGHLPCQSTPTLPLQSSEMSSL